MLNFGNKEFRNLQEQVLENMKNIEKIEDVKIIGVDVNYIVDTVADMEAIEEPEAGNVCAVGTSAPFTLYVYYEDEWVSLGEFPRQGPQGLQGEQGIQGPVGPQGPMGPQGPQGPRGFTGAAGATGAPGVKGDTGAQGPTGAAGRDGLTTDIYVNSHNYTQVDGTIALPDYVKTADLESITFDENQVTGGTTLGSITIGEDSWNIPEGGSDAVWGQITGTLSDQTDLANALAAKANSASLATVATSGDYDDLLNKPTIPAQLTAGDDITITNNEIETIYGGSEITSTNSTSEYTEGITFSRRTGAYFQTNDQTFSDDIKALETISQAQISDTPASFKITMYYIDELTSEQITLLDGTYSGVWSLSQEEFMFNNTTVDPVNGQDVIDVAYCRTASGGLFNIRFAVQPAFSSVIVSDFKLTINPTIITPINDKFISSNIARNYIAGQDIDITNNTIKTVYDGGYNPVSYTLTNPMFECYQTGSTTRFRVYDPVFINWLHIYVSNSPTESTNNGSWLVNCTISDGTNSMTYSGEAYHTYTAIADTIQLRNSNSSWGSPMNLLTVFHDNNSVQDTAEITFVGNNSAAYNFATTGSYDYSGSLSITYLKNPVPISDGFISNTIARTSQIPTATDDITLTGNALKTIYGGLPEKSVIYNTETFTDILTYPAPDGSTSHKNNFRSITDTGVVNAMYHVDKEVYPEWLTKTGASSGDQMWYKLTYSISLVDLTDGIRYTVESRSDVDVYFNNSQDFAPYTEGYFLRTYFYRTSSGDVRFGVFDPSTGNTVSFANLILALNTRDSRNYDLSTLQFDTFKIDINVVVPLVPINDAYISSNIARTNDIPAAVSGVNDGTNWTSLTIGSDTYGIGGGSSITITTSPGYESISDGTNTLNVMTRDTTQTITGLKTIREQSLRFTDGIDLKIINHNTLNGSMDIGTYKTGGNGRGSAIVLKNGSSTSIDFCLTSYNGVTPSINTSTPILRLASMGGTDPYFGPIGQTNGVSLGNSLSNYQWKNLYLSDTAYVGTIICSNLPTTDPQVAGALWNDNGTLKVSSGI